MSKLPLLLFTATLALWAADFWQTKPFANWDQKEVQKILTDSPWAHKLTVATPGGGGLGPGRDGGGGGGGGRGGGRSGPQGPTTDPGIGGGGGGGIAETGGAGGRTAGFGAGGGGNDSASITPAIPVLVTWQTSLPVRQALAKFKYGAEVATSPDAKTMLAEQQYYIISVGGLPGYIQPRDEQAKQAIVKQSMLNTKGKDSLGAVDVQFKTDKQNVDAFFVFPRMTPFTVEDKEVEFVTKAGPIGVKYKFNLKNMVFNGKLEM